MDRLVVMLAVLSGLLASKLAVTTVVSKVGLLVVCLVEMSVVLKVAKLVDALADLIRMINSSKDEKISRVLPVGFVGWAVGCEVGWEEG